MRTLLILCAGSRQINHLPICLNIHPDGKLLAEKAIEGICVESYDRVVYVITTSMDEKYNAREILLSGINRSVEVVCISEDTNGPADTVFYALKEANISGEFAVRDCLDSISISKSVSGNFVVGLDLTRYNQDVYKVRTKSFIIINEQNQILDIVEKRFRSDLISVGLYGFKSTKEFFMAYEKLKDPNYSIKKLYLSNIISYLIGYNQRIFHYVPTTMFEDWGSVETWNQLQRKYATCIIDADGVLGKILTENNLDEIANIIARNSKAYMSYVVMTSGEVRQENALKKLTDKGINCVGFISGISQSNRKVIITDEEGLQHYSMEKLP